MMVGNSGKSIILAVSIGTLMPNIMGSQRSLTRDSDLLPCILFAPTLLYPLPRTPLAAALLRAMGPIARACALRKGR